MMPPHLPLFVFGSLRRGEEHHQYLDGLYRRMLPAVLVGYRRTMAAHGYLTIFPEAANRVEGELYFLTETTYETTLRHCDDLEGIAPGEIAGRHYRRSAVSVETCEGAFAAWAYVDTSATPAN